MNRHTFRSSLEAGYGYSAAGLPLALAENELGMTSWDHGGIGRRPCIRNAATTACRKGRGWPALARGSHAAWPQIHGAVLDSSCAPNNGWLWESRISSDETAHQSNRGRSLMASSIVTKGCGAVPCAVLIERIWSPFGNLISKASARGKSCVGCGKSGNGCPESAAMRKNRTRVCGVP